ncbi:MAG TPA: rod shape-determining protein MreC [Phnomibacter sp.]|nr:rod shape-determining protein MreC [Phnomibacter sp.]
MKNFFLLLRRSYVLLLFLVLQGVCISLLVKYNKSHQARYMELAYDFTGSLNKKYADIVSYFSLSDNNKKLAEENNRLRNLLAENFTTIDTLSKLVRDTVKIDSSKVTRKFLWRTARVINNSVSSQNNFITLERGRLQGIGPEMAVVSASGIVGIVTDVSDNMAIVKSLLHRKSTTSVMLKNGGTTGLLEWDGVNPQALQLKGIPKSTVLKVGDTVLTSNISLNYPTGLMVGTISKVEKQTDGNNYRLQVKPGTNFYNVDFVDVIENLFLKEQQDLEQRGVKH